MEKDDISLEKTSVKDFFNKSDFIIPGYQRPYEWDSERIETLLNNFLEAFRSKEKVYLLGTIQLNNYELNSKSTYEIIDGHQRLTTLYLIKKHLGECPTINYSNQINGAKSIDDLIQKEKVYKDNYEFIGKYIDDSDIEHSQFNKFIDNNVIFIEITIKNCTSISDTLKIFDTLNTSGLKLDVKDIFKIEFTDFLSQTVQDSSEVIHDINKAYNNVLHPLSNDLDEVYCLKESDLLDAFRFLLISKMEKHQYATELKQSNSFFFERIFKNEINITVNYLDEFSALSECIKSTQIELFKRDQEEQTTTYDIVLGNSKELLDWSGYGRIKNLYYYLSYYFYVKINKQISKETINFCDAVINSIWRYCSLFRLAQRTITNGVLNDIGSILFDDLIDCENTEEYIKSVDRKLSENIDNLLRNDGNCFNYFTEIISKKGDVYGCRLPHLFMYLSYIEDVFEIGDKTIKNVKQEIGYGKNKGLEIEHIVSRKIAEKYSYEYVNSIGNLMYLSKNTNRRLGGKVEQYINEQDANTKDFVCKISEYKRDLNYAGSASVKAFLEKYEDNSNFIDDRNTKKIQFLKEIYKYDFLKNGFVKLNISN
ncbi:MAG: DUF262 domain-containing protein [Clostridia bacterium]|nr:DUF262 domain-containing protein [Clostridia bacterium]